MVSQIFLFFTFFSIVSLQLSGILAVVSILQYSNNDTFKVKGVFQIRGKKKERKRRGKGKRTRTLDIGEGGGREGRVKHNVLGCEI